MRAAFSRPSVPAIAAAILLCAFTPAGWRGVRGGLRSGAFRPPIASFTTDSYLYSIVGPDASERIIHGFAALPADKPVVIITSDADKANGFVPALFTYLLWPREVRGVFMSQAAVETSVRGIDPAKLAALAFYKVTPPAYLGSGIPMGNDLRLFPLGSAR